MATVLPVSAQNLEVKAAVEGVYTLDEWHSDGKILRPPQAEGKIVFRDGAVVFILIDNMQDSKRTSVAAFGTYTLHPNSFSYGYDNWSEFTQTPANMTLSRRVPWEGMREFAVKQEDNTVRLQYSGGKAEFVFTPEGMTYSIGGQVVRVWHRVKGQ